MRLLRRDWHRDNVVNGHRFDLTSEQFGGKAGELRYDEGRVQVREAHFVKEEKRRRYAALKAGLASR